MMKKGTIKTGFNLKDITTTQHSTGSITPINISNSLICNVGLIHAVEIFFGL